MEDLNGMCELVEDLQREHAQLVAENVGLNADLQKLVGAPSTETSELSCMMFSPYCEADLMLLRKYNDAIVEKDVATQRNVCVQLREEVLRMRQLLCEYESALIKLREDVEQVNCRCSEALAATTQA